MNYRIEFLADESSAQLPSPLGEMRFPSYVRAIHAARLGADLLIEELALPLVVNIFDRHERLATRVRHAGSSAACAGR